MPEDHEEAEHCRLVTPVETQFTASSVISRQPALSPFNCKPATGYGLLWPYTSRKKVKEKTKNEAKRHFEFVLH